MLALVLQVAGAGLTYALYVALAHWAGTESFGAYSYALAWATVLSVVAGLGLPEAAVRFVPQLRSQGLLDGLLGFIRVGRAIILGASLIASAAGTAAVAIIGGDHFPGGLATAVPGFWLVPVAALILFEANISRSLGKVTSAYGPMLVMRPLGVILVAAIVAYGTNRLSAAAAVWSAFGVFAAVALLQVGLVNRQVRSLGRAAQTSYDTRAWMSVSIPLLLVTGFQVLLAQTDVIIVGAVGGAHDAALYNAATKTAILVAYVLGAIEFVAAPTFATLLGGRNMDELQRLVKRAAKWVFWPSLGIAVVIAVAAPLVLRLFGPDFTAARWPLTILVGAQLVNAAFGSVGYILTLSGHQNVVARVYAATALFNVVSCYVLTRSFGLTGAAVATALSIALSNAWLNESTIRHVGVHASLLYAVRRRRVP